MLPLFPAAIVLLLLLSFVGRNEKDVSRRPSRFTGRRSSDVITYDIIEDVVSQTPAQIQAAIKRKLGREIPINVVALAGAIASESSGPTLAQIGIGWAIRNYAAREGKSILAAVAPDGRFAAQGLPGHSYVSTRLPPTKHTIQIAEAILASPPRIKDPTRGAIQFDSPRTQRALLAQGRVSRTPEQVAAKRRAAGRREIHLPGISPDELRFWA